MNKRSILSPWVPLSGNESIAVYQVAVQKVKRAKFLEPAVLKRIRVKFSWKYFFLNSCWNGLLKRTCHQGGLLLGPSLAVTVTVLCGL